MEALSLFAAQIEEEDQAIAAQAAALKDAQRDRVGERLVELNYVSSEFCLSNNAHIGTWPKFRDDETGIRVSLEHPWHLPTRVFQWPVQMCRYNRDEGYIDNETIDTQLGIWSTDLNDHPLVKMLRADGFEVKDECVLYDTMNHEQWFHSCDLCTNEFWEAMLETKQFTTDEAICSAIQFNIGRRSYTGDKASRGPILSLKSARDVLAALGSKEPKDRLVCRKFMAPSLCDKSYPINAHMKDKEAEAWAQIHAMEDGLIAFRGSHLTWTEKGRALWP